MEIIDYLMEGFVPYLISVTRMDDGLVIVVTKMGTNRDDAVDWFIEKYLTSNGLIVTRGSA